MESNELKTQISKLVDYLRKNSDAQVSLTEIASVTEVLIGTMQTFFSAIDTSVYKECRSLSDYITNARREIIALQPADLESNRIPRAGMELDAIVQQTEEATNTIMEAAEEIMGLDPEDTATYTATTQEAVLRIFEACSFQDITGQRISKVVNVLSNVESRVLELRNLLDITDAEVQAAVEIEKGTDAGSDAALLRGPALEGEGIDQGDVDALLGDTGSGDGPAPAASPEPSPAPAAPDPEPAKPAAKAAAPKPAQAAPPATTVEPPKPVDPAQLDSMFEEDFDFEGGAKKAGAADAAHSSKKQEAQTNEPSDKASEEKQPEKSEAENKEPGKKQAPKAEAPELTPGEEVSQDDIDALFS